jgi:8-oxo-dGTP diphosphatase
LPKQMIDKIAWIHLKGRKVLFARSKGVELFYTPGGKREEGESDSDALVREIKEELDAELIRDSLRLLKVFEFEQAHGKPIGVGLKMSCYTGEFKGRVKASSEIEELTWLSSKDKEKTTEPGKMILDWLKGRDLID